MSDVANKYCDWHVVETLKDEFSVFPALVNTGNQLLEALVIGVQMLEASPSLSQPPSPDTSDLLSRLNNTDPNADSFDPTDEDNNNSGWGHYQYTAGGRNIANSLATWESIGSVEFARRLLAASVRTCKVARFLCESRKRTATSFLADAYLSNLVDHIWGILPPLYKVRHSMPRSHPHLSTN
jgi:hypothetical protein